MSRMYFEVNLGPCRVSPKKHHVGSFMDGRYSNEKKSPPQGICIRVSISIFISASTSTSRHEPPTIILPKPWRTGQVEGA